MRSTFREKSSFRKREFKSWLSEGTITQATNSTRINPEEHKGEENCEKRQEKFG